MIWRALSTSSCVNRLDTGISILSEPEPDADQRRTRWSQDDVRWMQLVVVVTIRQVVYVGMDRGIFVDLVLDHRVENPIAGRLFYQPGDGIERHGATGGTRPDEVAAHPDTSVPGELIGVP